MSQEQWKTIIRHPEYMVSDLGRAKTMKYVKCRDGIKDKVLKIQWLPSGYGQIRCYTDGHWEPCYIHRLVYEAFTPDDPLRPFMVVDHRDDNPRNNALSNLQQVTYSRNLGKSSRWDTPTDQAIETAKSLRLTGMTYDRIATHVGVSPATIWRWCHDTQNYMREGL